MYSVNRLCSKHMETCFWKVLKVSTDLWSVLSKYRQHTSTFVFYKSQSNLYRVQNLNVNRSNNENLCLHIHVFGKKHATPFKSTCSYYIYIKCWGSKKSSKVGRPSCLIVSCEVETNQMLPLDPSAKNFTLIAQYWFQERIWSWF